jgi:hypothetical protein
MEYQKPKQIKRKHIFDLSEKCQLVKFAGSPGYTSAMVCKEYNIYNTLFGWKSQIDTMLEYEKGKFTMHQGPKVKGDQIVTSFIDDAKGKQAECTVREISLLIIKYDNQFMWMGNLIK